MYPKLPQPLPLNRNSAQPAAWSAPSWHFGALCLGGLFLTACSGGGGGGTTDPGAEINQGTYSVDDFNYTDDRPAGVHPLKQDGFKALSRDELFTIIPTHVGPARSYEMREGPDEGDQMIAEANGLFGGLGEPFSAVRAQLDEDAEDELVVAVRQGGTWINIVRVDRMPDGSYSHVVLHGVSSSMFSIADVRVSVADVDNDFRDEIFVVGREAMFGLTSNRGEVWGFQDPIDGGGQILNFFRQGAHVDLFAHGVDIDGDGAQEVVVALAGDSTDAGRFPIRLFDLGESDISMTEVHGWRYLYSANDFNYGRLAVGDFDGNGHEDLAWVGYKVTSSSATARIKLFEYQANNTWSEYGSFASVSVNPTSGVTATRFGVTAFYPRVGQADVAVAFPDGNGWRYGAFHFDRGINQWTVETSGLDRHLHNQTITLEAADVDADGVEEVQVGLLHFGADRSMDLGYLEHENGVQQVWQNRVLSPTSAVVGNQRPGLVLAPGDFDADGFVLESTGRRDVKVGSPIPLVLLAAPPTKAGISQNYDDTESMYSIAQTAGSSIGVTTHSSLTKTAEAGFDLFGVLGVSARYSVDRATERTSTTSEYVTNVTGYRGAYDSDVIVFQGTLYETYEYVITAASDPNAIGALVTLDFPVDANTYKWTVDYYNSQVAPEDRIGPDVLTHTVGDITSYPSRFELDQLTLGEVHWDFNGSRPVSQGGASDFQAVSFAEEQASEVQRTVTKSYGGGLSIGIGGSVDKTNSSGTTHSTMYGTEATFEASVGDISGFEDYENWRYNWGFSVHTVGRLADGNNVPNGYTERKHHFQYLRYWVDLTGAGY